MDNFMWGIGFLGQWAKANPKIPSILVVLGVALLGYGGFWLSPDFVAAKTTWGTDAVRGFIAAGGIWAMKGITALQLTSAAASGASQLNLPDAMKNALPVTKN